MICPLYIEPDPFDWMYQGVKAARNMANKKKKDKSASIKSPWPSIGDFGVGPVAPVKNVRQVRFLNLVHLYQVRASGARSPQIYGSN